MPRRKKPPVEFADFGLVSLAEFLDDRFVYRDLQPVDRQYQGYIQCARLFGLDPASIPRKTDPAYNKVAVWIVEHLQERQKDAEVEELLFIGDTVGTDAVAFQKMAAYARWAGSCFIGAEDLTAPPAMQWDDAHRVVTANRWTLLADWLQALRAAHMALDERTAVILDMDKTLLGARGRNDQVIDEARLVSLHQALETHMADDFHFDEFRSIYDTISRPAYIGLTGDNQDYIIYICLMIQSGIINIREVGGFVQQNMLFDHLVRWISTQMDKNLSMQMRQLHDQYQMCIRNGDATPFKQFRRQEFLNTVQRMGHLQDDVSSDERLQSEICITQEVREASLWFQERGCLLLSLSDKPKEATMPHTRWHKGLEPIHRIRTHAVGVSLQDELAALA